MTLFRWLLLLAFCALGGCGKSEPPLRGEPALWEVVGPSGQKAWLFGTVHSMPEGTIWRTALFDKAFAEADSLVLEIASIDDAQATARQFQRLSASKGLPPLSGRVPPQQSNLVRNALHSAGLDDDGYGNMETWGAALSLSRAAQSNFGGIGADAQMLEMAGGKPVLEFEGAANQLAIFDRLPEQEQTDLLVNVAQEVLDRRNDDAKLLRAWLDGDTAVIENLTTQGMLADPELRKALLSDRNRQWHQKLLTYLDEGRRPFVAVGAAHVVGPDGLISLLLADGFKVNRLQ